LWGGIGGSLTLSAGDGGTGIARNGAGGSTYITSGSGSSGGGIYLRPGTGTQNGQVFIRTNSSDTYVQRLCHSGTNDPTVATDIALGDCTNSGQADYAEMYIVESSADFGDVVSMGDNDVVTKDCDVIMQLLKLKYAYDVNDNGIISTQ